MGVGALKFRIEIPDASGDYTGGWWAMNDLNAYLSAISWSGTNLKGVFYIDVGVGEFRSSNNGLSAEPGLLYEDIVSDVQVTSTIDMTSLSDTGVALVSVDFANAEIFRVRYVADSIAPGTGSIYGWIYGKRWA